MSKFCIDNQKINGICKHEEEKEEEDKDDEDKEDKEDTDEEDKEETTEEKEYEVVITLKASGTKFRSKGKGIILDGDTVEVSGCPKCESGKIKSKSNINFFVNGKRPIVSGDLIELECGTEIYITDGDGNINV